MNRMIIDVETANGFSTPLVYDLGFKVVNADFETIIEGSYVVQDIFFDEPEKMDTAYYAEKIPMYIAEIENGSRCVACWSALMRWIDAVCYMFHVKQVWAFNAQFDYKAIMKTSQYLTGLGVSWFDEVEWHCIAGAAVSTFMNSKNYFQFCVENDLISDKGNVKTSAEAGYRYIANMPEFAEKHCGLADVKIETELLKRAMRYHKKMDTRLTSHWQAIQPKFKEYMKNA